MNWIFISPYGIGDVFLLCALSKAFLETHGGEKIQIYTKQPHLALQNLFPKQFVDLVLWEETLIDETKFNHLEKGRPFLAHPYHALNKKSGISTLGAPGTTLLSLYLKTLCLPSNASLLKPKVTESSWSRTKKIIDKMGLKKGKTVILAPDCNSIPTFSEEIWKGWISDLYREGLDVCILSRGARSLQSLPILNCSLDEMIPVAEWCGRVISIRSGICELLSSAKCKLTILYPSLPHYAGTLFSAYSLRLMGISDKAEEKVLIDGRWENA